MTVGKKHWDEWTAEATSWWLDGENITRVLVSPGDLCLFEQTPTGGVILRDVKPRVASS